MTRNLNCIIIFLNYLPNCCSWQNKGHLNNTTINSVLPV